MDGIRVLKEDDRGCLSPQRYGDFSEKRHLWRMGEPWLFVFINHPV